MPEYRLTYRCELLEDLHSGSGLGWLSFVDDCQARDARDRPVVWDTTLGPLLRNVADELCELVASDATPDRIRAIFGAEGPNARGRLVPRSLHFEWLPGPDGDRPVEVYLTSTARETFSRRPLDQTLRTIEAAAAGLVASGELRVHGDAAAAAFVKRCLQRLPSLGGGKSRGDGRVRVTDLTMVVAPATQTVPLPHRSGRLRLLFHTLEPVCLAATGSPGNIIPTLTHFPGQAIRGAVLQALADAGANEDELNPLADASQAHFGNGYYVPADLAPGEAANWDLALIASQPLPLSALEARPTAAPTSGPWWAQPAAGSDVWRADPDRERDLLIPRKETEDDVRFDRVKTDDYLASGSGAWRRVRPAVRVQLRNQTPVSRVGRVYDSRRFDDKAVASPTDRGDLFAATVLAEDQLFVADIVLRTADVAARFGRVAGPLLTGAPADRSWLRLGRGGKPVRVDAWQWIDDTAPRLPDQELMELTVTLTSDLIARADDLTFLTALDGDVLADLSGVPTARGKITVEESAVDTTIIHGFNASAGTRRAPALAIRRGSAVRLTPRSANDAVTLQELFKTLAQLEAQGLGLGERQEEGFGRFALNHAAHQPRVVSSGPAARVSQAGPAAAMPEATIERVLTFVEMAGLEKRCRRRDFPSRSQWQWLRHEAEARTTADGLARLLDEVDEAADRLGGRRWATPVGATRRPLHKWMRDECCGTLTEPRTFLIYLARWVAARQAEHDENEEGGAP
jgi:hypothetical protein